MLYLTNITFWIGGPMATAVIMPRNGQSVESCVITAWHKQVGDDVHIGDTLFSYETDKSSFEEEAKVEGKLLAILYEEFDDVPCLENVCVIGEEGEDISEFKKKESAPKKDKAQQKEEKKENKPETTIQTTGKISGVSPRAKNTAERLRVNLNNVEPTGPNGRIIERDVLNAQKSTAGAYASGISGTSGTGIGGRMRISDEGSISPFVSSGDYNDVHLSNLRQIIGSSMSTSLLTIPQLTHMASFDATSLLETRKELKEKAEKEGKPSISINDMILYAVSRILPKYPELNANRIDEETIRYFNHVNLGIAVDTPRGLLVPTLFKADEKSLEDIAKESKQLAEEARLGSINPDLLTGGTFTVSNVGTLDIEYFTPVINPPQTGILGVGGLIDKCKEVDGKMVMYKSMGLSLSFDHASLDGVLSAKFLKELRDNLENYQELLNK